MFFVGYNLLLSLIYPLYYILSWFVASVNQFRKGREESLERLLNHSFDRPVWLHASSVGELDQALGILRAIKKKKPSKQVVVSVFSKSVAKLDHPEIDLMFRLPLDFPWSWNRIIQKMNPCAFATMTWDVFPNLLRSLSQKRIPAFLACAALSEDSSRLRFPMLQMWRPVYALFAGIGCVDDANRQHFLKLLDDESRVRVTGDSRYDTIFHKLAKGTEPKLVRNLSKKNRISWILASTYESCEKEIVPHLSEFLRDFPNVDLKIFPHFIGKERMNQIQTSLAANGIESSLLSENANGRAVIVDSLGILAYAYRYATLCYVGGGFHHRIHNTGEPAALGVPVLTGPSIDTSPVALLLESENCLIRCQTGSEIVGSARRMLLQESPTRKTGKKAKTAMGRQKGGSEKFLNRFLIKRL